MNKIKGYEILVEIPSGYRVIKMPCEKQGLIVGRKDKIPLEYNAILKKWRKLEC